MIDGPVAARLRASAQATGRRLEAVAVRLGGLPGVGTGVRAIGRYNEAGGGVLARGLAFAFLFALLPAIVLVSSLAALLAGDPDSRAGILEALARQFPPLAPILGETVSGAVAVAPTMSVISIGVLLWSASGMVRALDVAIGLVFREQQIPRSPLRLVGLVLAIGGALLTVTILFAMATVSGPLGELVGIGLNARLTAVVALAGLIVLAFRWLPRRRPPWRVVVVPGVITTLAIAFLTTAFAWLSPLLIGSVQVFGTLAVVFLGIVWLGFSTDAFLFGAAWTAVTAEDAEAAARLDPPAGLREAGRRD